MGDGSYGFVGLDGRSYVMDFLLCIFLYLQLIYFSVLLFVFILFFVVVECILALCFYIIAIVKKTITPYSRVFDCVSNNLPKAGIERVIPQQQLNDLLLLFLKIRSG
jgi:hypothetical protein